MSEDRAKTRIHWFARLEHRVHVWRESRARRRGRTATVLPFAGYGGTGWVRVVGRVLIVPPRRPNADGEYASVRGWRSFVGIPVGFARADVVIAGQRHEVTADRGGVIDTVIKADLDPGWQTFTMSVEAQKPIEGSAFIVGDDVTFGVLSDIDDTVMVTALPRPFVAAWNSFVVDEHARLPVPGMAVLLEQLMRQHPGSPMIYLSTGAWNVAPTLSRFMSRHLFPSGAMLLTDWGPTHDRWFRSGREHKLINLRRLAEEFPHVRWLLIGDDGQHDEAIYTEFMNEHPQCVAGVAIRQLSTAEAVLAGGRASSDDHSEDTAPWVAASDGAGLREQLTDVGILH
ncbi:phosphatidate phosphatase APP1 [Microbacterium ginsengiterrae]|uniref:Phosphatidate phosphatase APP1 n=1 Tax=Microbacterium ginsengiterrae TaxID=546115 RepID=A0A7W9CFR3_9MICO|nr:phosphatase domain-containing protein [Microbacterium ginsengiterrae]MBB5744392.1 phosphatidate phosphatase APP1 [Microbacterium ginsengiterrae]